MWGRSREIARFAAYAAAAWWLFGTGVLHASDDPVADISQGDSTPQPQPDRPPAPRRWQQQLDWERPPPQPGAATPRHDYREWLIASYVSFPVLAFGAPLLVSELWDVDTATAATAIIAPAAAFSLPMAAHWAHGDKDRALRAILAYPALTLGATVLGGFIGAQLTTAEESMNSDGTAGFVNALKGAAIGGSAAIIGWAIYDVVETSTSIGERRRYASAPASASVAVFPHPHGALASVAGRF